MTGVRGPGAGAPADAADADQFTGGSVRSPSGRRRRQALFMAIAASILVGVSVGAWFPGGERLDGGGGGWVLPAEAGKPVTVGVVLETRGGGEVTLIRARVARPEPTLDVSIAAVHSPNRGVGSYVGHFPFSPLAVEGTKVHGQSERFESWSKMWLALSFSTSIPGAYAFEDVDVTYSVGHRVRTARLPVSVCYLAITPGHYDAVVAHLRDQSGPPTALDPGESGLTPFTNECRERG